MRAYLTASSAAIDLVEQLAREHGPLLFFQTGGSLEGSQPLCLKQGELVPGPRDLLLGAIAAAPFYVDAEQYARWGRPPLFVDVRAGAAEGFSLSAPDAHFVTRPPSEQPDAGLFDGAAEEERRPGGPLGG